MYIYFSVSSVTVRERGVFFAQSKYVATRSDARARGGSHWKVSTTLGRTFTKPPDPLLREINMQRFDPCGNAGDGGATVDSQLGLPVGWKWVAKIHYLQQERSSPDPSCHADCSPRSSGTLETWPKYEPWKIATSINIFGRILRPHLGRNLEQFFSRQKCTKLDGMEVGSIAPLACITDGPQFSQGIDFLAKWLKNVCCIISFFFYFNG